MRGVIGVIGHVDHGKTALVRALTGMETDRLAEERRRGISIALGFAHLTIGDTVIDLIDMPGHERFVRTMAAGATGVAAALLVVAANEGIKPQTVEHLDIAALLGLRRIVVAVSKIDLAPGNAAAVGHAAAALARSLGLTVEAIVPTSVVAGAGLAALTAALVAATAPEAVAADDGFAWLPIDRAFSVAGHGTVVTGTLRRGPLAVSDAVVLAPQGGGAGRPVRLRGLQVHGRRVSEAQAGQRVAANLRDVAPGEVARGAALLARTALPPAEWLTVALRSVAGAPPLASGTSLMLLFGTEEVAARLRLLDADELAAGGTAMGQLRCAWPVAVPAREHFILRRASPACTLAGGRVIDPSGSRLRRHSPGVVSRLVALAAAQPATVLALELAAAGTAGVPIARLAALAGVSDLRAAQLLAGSDAVLGRGKVAVSAADFARVSAGIAGALDGAGDLAIDAVAAALPRVGRAVLEEAVAELVRRGTVLRTGAGLRLHRPQRERARADAEAATAAELADTLRRGGLTPPDPAALAPGPQARRLVERLIREGVVIRAMDRVQKREILFHADAVETAKRRLAPLLAAGPGMAVGEAGAALGITRKFCVPLLEHLDAIHFTRRVADRRVLAGR